MSKVRNQNGLTVEEFHAMSAKELAGLIRPVLAKFAIEPGKYSLEQSVALVKRIKAWGEGEHHVDAQKHLLPHRWYRLILIGMMITNNQMMILGLTLITFIVVNWWVSGHGDIGHSVHYLLTICTKAMTFMWNCSLPTDQIGEHNCWMFTITFPTK